MWTEMASTCCGGIKRGLSFESNFSSIRRGCFLFKLMKPQAESHMQTLPHWVCFQSVQQGCYFFFLSMSKLNPHTVSRGPGMPKPRCWVAGPNIRVMMGLAAGAHLESISRLWDQERGQQIIKPCEAAGPPSLRSQHSAVWVENVNIPLDARKCWESPRDSGAES